ncbi:hypothetical protein [Paracoccus marcusii]|uniref:hypothetical protein n=1 Tax=Paracoccus marcusii TaxID=59779 RepID=UPI001431DA2D|nr:hypothetical protein [Paracoccus marcusii]
MREKTLGGLMRWEWIGLPILIAAAVLLSWIVHRTLKVLRHHARGQIATGILTASSKPLIIASVTRLVWWVTGNVFVFSGRINVFVTPAIAMGVVTALLQDKRFLRLREPRCFHRSPLLSQPGKVNRKLQLQTVQFPGGRARAVGERASGRRDFYLTQAPLKQVY